MSKKKHDEQKAIEDRVASSEGAYQRMMDRLKNGQIDRVDILSAIEQIQTAHYIALKVGRRDLCL